MAPSAVAVHTFDVLVVRFKQFCCHRPHEVDFSRLFTGIVHVHPDDDASCESVDVEAIGGSVVEAIAVVRGEVWCNGGAVN